MFFICGCSISKKETVLYECSLRNSLEFYDGSFVTEVFSKDEKNVSKLHMVSSYSAKWDDVNHTDLLTKLQTEKQTLERQYEKVTYEIHQLGNNITTEQTVVLTDHNLDLLANDAGYQKSMKNGKLLIENYVQFLTNNGYSCQIKK